jgi:two-component system nitrogen regulation response regulator GlnG
VAAPGTSPAAARETPSPSPLSLNDALDFVYSRLKEEGKEPVLERLEREMITRVLKDENGNLVRASERLGITRTTLRKRIDAFGLRL